MASQKKKKQQQKPKAEAPVIISKKHKLILGIIIALVSFAIYANSIGNNYVLDDYSVIKENFVV
ncbi:MAG: hypothetical protein ABIJ16_08440, partial [Bacteroidota bacterium]